LILNDTVRNNIIFNKPYERERYNTVVRICQLEPDFELLKQGDLTIISDKGDNLSGGQKTRLTIARAVYSDAYIYLFDDPLSALDAYVGRNIFEKVIKEYLKGKTVLIITHALQYIPMMDYVIRMNEGEIEYFGNVKDAEKQDFYKDFVSANQTKNFEESINNHIKMKKNEKKPVESELESDFNESEQFSNMLFLFKTLEISHFDKSGKDSKDEQLENISLIINTLLVFQLEISGILFNKVHPENKESIFITFIVLNLEISGNFSN